MRIVFALIACLVATGSANAGYIFVNSASGLINDGLINWGDPNATTTAVPNPSTLAITGMSGQTAIVSVSAATNYMGRSEQSKAWAGNFAPGASLIWTAGNYGPLDIVFSRSMAGAGSQFQTTFYGVFTANISAYDFSNNLLASFNFSGNSTATADNSAVFAGILSTNADIHHIRFSGISASQQVQNFAIGNMTVQAAPAVAVVPEPMTAIMFGSLLVGTFGVAQLRRKKCRFA